MKNKLKYIITTAIMVQLTSACSIFSDDKVSLKGERVSVMSDTVNLKPDYDISTINVKLPAPYINAAWSQNGGNATHNMGHIYTNNNIKEIWTKNFGSGNSKRNVLISTPIVAYKVVFTIDADGVIKARRLDNGAEIWETKLSPLNEDDADVSMKGAGLAEFDKKIFATTGFGDVFALDMINGKVLWRFQNETPIRIAPTVDNNLVFVQTIENELITLDAKTGEKLWNYKTTIETTTLVGGASPAYHKEKDIVVAAFSNGEIRTLKASTGTPLWANMLTSKKRINSLSNITTIKANPVIDKDTIFASSNNNILVALDIRTGQRIWEREIATHSQPWIAGKFLFVLSSNLELLSIEKSSGKILWNTIVPLTNEDLRGKTIANGPILVGNRLIITTSDGFLFAVSPYNGDIISYISIGDNIELTPIAAEEVVIFTTSDADLIAYK